MRWSTSRGRTSATFAASGCIWTKSRTAFFPRCNSTNASKTLASARPTSTNSSSSSTATTTAWSRKRTLKLASSALQSLPEPFRKGPRSSAPSRKETFRKGPSPTGPSSRARRLARSRRCRLPATRPRPSRRTARRCRPARGGASPTRTATLPRVRQTTTPRRSSGGRGAPLQQGLRRRHRGLLYRLGPRIRRGATLRATLRATSRALLCGSSSRLRGFWTISGNKKNSPSRPRTNRRLARRL
mmetsp:Transcript_26160/g.87916  ORF Transcript_26160/g.87916 Transcript_26160/m.87916 type:complete len:243 (-) Transcript_26160:25-753(-)